MFTAWLGGVRDAKRFGNRLNIASNLENSASPPQALRTFHICSDIVNKAKSIKREVHGVGNGGEEFWIRLLKSDITATHLPSLEVEGEERQYGHPDLIPFRAHVQTNEGRSPRELNTFKLHRCCPLMALRRA